MRFAIPRWLWLVGSCGFGLWMVVGGVQRARESARQGLAPGRLGYRLQRVVADRTGSKVRFEDACFLGRPGLLVTTSYVIATQGARPGPDARLQVWNADSWEIVRAVPGALHIAGLSRDCRALLATGGHERAFLVDTVAWHTLWTAERTPGVALHPDGRTVAVVRLGGDGWRVDLESTRSGRVEARLTPANAIFGFSPDGAFLAAGEEDGLGGALFDLRGREVRALPIPSTRGRAASALAWSGAPDLVWLADWSGGVTLYRCPSWSVVRRLKTARPVVRMSPSADGRWLATSGRMDRIDLWDLTEGRVVQTLATDTPFAHVAFSPDAGCLVVPSGGRLEIFRAARAPTDGGSAD